MNKTFYYIVFLIVVLVSGSCRKTIDPSNDGDTAFVVRLLSLQEARFEAYCTTEDVFLDKVMIQSPNGLNFVQEYEHQYFTKGETFIFGNLAADDGMWLLTFIGTSAITDKTFQVITPYDMILLPDDSE
ncbi:MAG TPA: hypothetical protein DCG69_02995 [Bacteroidales bacterium]|nr:hypothetical protein [Bacteroidales bacterium]